jgi:predicted lipoprotein with Yx(FWY)xxD motif
LKLCENLKRSSLVSITVRPHSGATSRRLLGGSVIFGAAIAVAACGASAGTSASGSGSSPSAAGSAGGAAAAASASAGAGGASSSTATVAAKNVPGVGTVLVNSKGQTLYMLTSEKGGKITCTASNGCTQAWPEVDLTGGATKATAGTGVQSALLSTVKGANGTEVTYNGWPLYTFAGDSGAVGVAKGQGLTSFGGTWYVLNAAGNPVTAKAAKAGSSPSSSSSSGSGGSGGYGY